MRRGFLIVEIALLFASIHVGFETHIRINDFTPVTLGIENKSSVFCVYCTTKKNYKQKINSRHYCHKTLKINYL